MRRASWLLIVLLGLLACEGSGDGTTDTAGGIDTAGGADTVGPADTISPADLEQPDYGDVALQPSDKQFLADYQAMLLQTTDLTTDELLARYGQPATYLAEPAFDPLPATGMELIDQAYQLTQPEKDKLSANGFVVTDRVRYDSHPMGYLDVYTKDLPVLVTTDSILFAVHNSYDLILKTVEQQALIPMLKGMLEAAHGSLAGLTSLEGDVGDAVKDVDLYYSVARSLLTGTPVAPLIAANEVPRDELLLQIEALEPQLIELFGRAYPCDGPGCAYDFSQFKPRGHYTETEELQHYFRSMIWLGRTELALTRFPRELLVSVLLRDTLDKTGQVPTWQAFDQAIQVFVGKSDNLTLDQFNGFLAEKGIDGAPSLTDATAIQALMTSLEESGLGQQKIMSQIMATNPLSATPTLLPPIFAFLGQRFVIDSYTFHNVTYDRIVWQGVKQERYMPDPLDAAFVLGYDQVLPLLQDELERYHYAQNLNAVRYLVDAYPADFWGESMYNVWLDAIRSLADVPVGDQVPDALQTEAWSRKALNTGLASWAELRHDTILYVKQSYTGVGCDYPDGYVEPYPAFFARVNAFATRSGELFGTLNLPVQPYLKDWVQAYFANLGTVASTLGAIADKELKGLDRTPDETAFLKQVVTQDGTMCGGPLFTGWYADLFFNAMDTTFEFKPTIADVHTDPNTESVLHVGTGRANLMVLSVETHCATRAYAGPVSSYYETIQGDFLRLTDEEWKATLDGDRLPDRPEWTSPFLVVQ
jgi:hypothetical protein